MHQNNKQDPVYIWRHDISKFLLAIEWWVSSFPYYPFSNFCSLLCSWRIQGFMHSPSRHKGLRHSPTLWTSSSMMCSYPKSGNAWAICHDYRSGLPWRSQAPSLSRASAHTHRPMWPASASISSPCHSSWSHSQKASPAVRPVMRRLSFLPQNGCLR